MRNWWRKLLPELSKLRKEGQQLLKMSSLVYYRWWKRGVKTRLLGTRTHMKTTPAQTALAVLKTYHPKNLKMEVPSLNPIQWTLNIERWKSKHSTLKTIFFVWLESCRGYFWSLSIPLFKPLLSSAEMIQIRKRLPKRTENSDKSLYYSTKLYHSNWLFEGSFGIVY